MGQTYTIVLNEDSNHTQITDQDRIRTFKKCAEAITQNVSHNLNVFSTKMDSVEKSVNKVSNAQSIEIRSKKYLLKLGTNSFAVNILWTFFHYLLFSTTLEIWMLYFSTLIVELFAFHFLNWSSFLLSLDHQKKVQYTDVLQSWTIILLALWGIKILSIFTWWSFYLLYFVFAFMFLVLFIHLNCF